jgi:ParB family chromosome partitioning protein
MTAQPDSKQRRALGRGLDALLPAAPSSAGAYGDKSVFSCALDKIVPQKGQPRQHLVHIDELAKSIEEHGLLEPIVVRRTSPGADKFEIIAGERRWRASQKAGLREVLVVVKDVSPEAAFELALIENVQREDLNAVELAEALDRLIREHGYTQETLAERIGRDRTTVTNSLRLLKLPERVRSKIVVGELTEGHARALLGAHDPSKIEQLAERVIRGKMSVRATEELVRKARGGAAGPSAPNAQNARSDGKSAAVKDLETRLSRALGARVEVRDRGNKGEIAIPYADLDALDRLIDKLL